MSRLLSRTWFPAAAVGMVAAQMVASHRDVSGAGMISVLPEITVPADTVIYPIDGYKRGWTDEEKTLRLEVADSLLGTGGEFGFGDALTWDGRPAALDSLVPPDSLALTDTFRFKYFAALRDSLSHVYIRDSLIAAGDSLEWPVLDSLYALDSAVAWKAEFDMWYASLDKIERRKYDAEQYAQLKLAQMDSIKNVKDSIRAYKDSVLESTPRVLDSYVFKDSMQYRRILSWTHDRDFHNVRLRDEDTSYNYRFNDYPFQREDVGGVWLGLPGAPVLRYDASRRSHEDGVYFYDPLTSWTYTPESLPFYNTKTPYTELAYWGSLFSGSAHASDNLHLMTTQNFTPALNLTLLYDRFGGDGTISNETTANKTTVAAVNYTGRRYLMHAGVIHNKVNRSESGGILDNMWIRDTTVDAREISVALTGASSSTIKNTIFLDQQYRIPFTFIERWRERRNTPSQGEVPDTTALPALTPLQDGPSADSYPGEQDGSVSPEADDDRGEESPAGEMPDDMDVATAYIGHSSEYSVYRRKYSDAISNDAGRELYNNVFYLNPTTSADSMRVSRLDNKVYLRLQPWSDTSIVSKLDVGAGLKTLRYFSFNPSYLSMPGNKALNSTYLYAGVRGQMRNYISWDALAHYTLLGDEGGDFDLSANAMLKLYPFRRARTSPVSIGAHFETSLQEPDWYSRHLVTNHFRWDNSFDKISTTRLRGSIDIPRWRLGAEVTYSLLASQLYYDAQSIIRQSGDAMSLLTASLRKDFVAGPLHFDNRVLLQLGPEDDVLPLPKVAVNSRYYIQLLIAKVLQMQVGADIRYTTSWYAQAWNPALGVFYNQKEEKYGNAPYFDAFVNMQWKRACIFVKLENAGMGWPMDRADYFSAHHFVRTQRAVKFGIFWPFYTQPERASRSSSSSGGAGRSGGGPGGALEGGPAL